MGLSDPWDRNLLEKVGNLRDIAVLVQLNLAFLTFTDLHLHSQIVSDYHPLFFNGFFEVNFFWMQWRGPVFSRSSFFYFHHNIFFVKPNLKKIQETYLKIFP